MAVRAVRGATQVDVDERDHVLERTREMITEVLERNTWTADDLVSVMFTATRDITSVAPALAARQLGHNDVALICVQEMWVEGSMPLVVRMVAHVETDLPVAQIENVYLHGTQLLRADVPPLPAP